MNIALALLGLGLNLAGIALQVSPFQNIWLTLLCMFVGGGCVFLGLFGNRQAAGGRSLLDRLYPNVINGIAIGGAIFAVFMAIGIATAVYNLYQRHLDIEAAKAGISTPIATPSSEPSER
jgi:hypothetical protein